jgi:hypothetical protein
MAATRKRRVRFFLSYAHADQVLVESFLREFEKQYKAAAHYDYQAWRDGQIPLGAEWRDAIEAAIRRCDCGLVLVSPAFLGSEFVRDHELPHFVGERAAKWCLPVGLDRVDFRHHDLRGLEEHQIFLKGGRFFGELRSAPQKREWVFELFTRIQERLDASFLSQRAS